MFSISLKAQDLHLKRGVKDTLIGYLDAVLQLDFVSATKLVLGVDIVENLFVCVGPGISICAVGAIVHGVGSSIRAVGADALVCAK